MKSLWTEVLHVTQLGTNFLKFLKKFSKSSFSFSEFSKNFLGINDDFFELGGDSVIAIQLVSKATKHKIHITINNVIKFFLFVFYYFITLLLKFVIL